jgi:hypothetical protein
MMTYDKFRWSSALVLALSVTVSCYAVAQDAPDSTKMSSAEIARELANPNTSLGSMAFLTDYISYTGDLPDADSQSAYHVSFQPAIPYPLGDGVNLFVRPLIPVYFDQPTPVVAGTPLHDPGGEFTEQNRQFEDTGTELGDIAFDVAIGKTFSNGMVAIGGVVGTLDTATDDAIGLGQTLLGPEFFLGKESKWGFVGALVSHQWDVAGDSDFDTSITAGQYFYTYNLENAWQIQAQPTWTYNHEAEGEKWTFPLGVGIAKTTVFGKLPVKFSLQYWHYIEQADALGPDYQIRFQVAPVVPLPW